MFKRNSIKLSEYVNIIQIFEIEGDEFIGEYQEIEFHEPASGRVHTVFFPDTGISSEALRTAADLIDQNRVENIPT